MEPDKLADDKTGFSKETVTSVLAGKYPHKNNPSCSTLGTYDKTPIFILVGITDDAVESVTRKL